MKPPALIPALKANMQTSKQELVKVIKIPSFVVFIHILLKGCSTICATCSSLGTNSCLTCYNGLYLYEATCVYFCPQGKYASVQAGACESNKMSTRFSHL